MIPNNDLSFQMFSSRAAATLDEQITLLAQLGYTDVQPFFFGPPADMAALDPAKSGHFTLDLFEDHPVMVVSVARNFGMSLAVCPWINPEDRPTDLAGWQAVGARMAAITTQVAAEGLTFAYHDHDFEMVPFPDGSYPIDHLLGDRVPFEPDLAWMVAGWARRIGGHV